MGPGARIRGPAPGPRPRDRTEGPGVGPRAPGPRPGPAPAPYNLTRPIPTIPTDRSFIPSCAATFADENIICYENGGPWAPRTHANLRPARIDGRSRAGAEGEGISGDTTTPTPAPTPNPRPPGWPGSAAPPKAGRNRTQTQPGEPRNPRAPPAPAKDGPGSWPSLNAKRPEWPGPWSAFGCGPPPRPSSSPGTIPSPLNFDPYWLRARPHPLPPRDARPGPAARPQTNRKSCRNKTKTQRNAKHTSVAISVQAIFGSSKHNVYPQA